jgi:hypothetical protein
MHHIVLKTAGEDFAGTTLAMRVFVSRIVREELVVTILEPYMCQVVIRIVMGGFAGAIPVTVRGVTQIVLVVFAGVIPGMLRFVLLIVEGVFAAVILEFFMMEFRTASERGVLAQKKI